MGKETHHMAKVDKLELNIQLLLDGSGNVFQLLKHMVEKKTEPKINQSSSKRLKA